MSEQTIKSSIKCVTGLDLFISGMEDLGNFKKNSIKVTDVLEHLCPVFIDPLGASILSIIHEMDVFIRTNDLEDEEKISDEIQGFMDKIQKVLLDYQPSKEQSNES